MNRTRTDVYDLFHEFFQVPGDWASGIQGLALYPRDQQLGQPAVLTLQCGGGCSVLKVSLPPRMATILETPELWSSLTEHRQMVEISDEFQRLLTALNWTPKADQKYHLSWSRGR